MNFKVGDIIPIEGHFVQIARRKAWCNISEFQLLEFIPKPEKHGVDLITNDYETELVS